jgi:hypothetical protein
MKKFLLLLAVLLSVSFSWAHPAIGIVKDSKGNIYYSDTKQVWKVDRNGKQTVVVPNIHTHELFMDSDDNLYGEHLWYKGESNTWSHYVWCLKKTGELVKVKGPQEGFLSDYSFVRDNAGNMYWVERFKTSRFKKKTPGGKVTTIAENNYRDIRWMYATPAGVLYFVNHHDLYKIDTKGTVTLLAKNLADNGVPADKIPSNDIFGIWTDADQNVYCAVSSDKAVKKITPAGVVSRVAETTGLWTPTGGVFDNNGNLWLLECNVQNEQRVRKIVRGAIGIKK